MASKWITKNNTFMYFGYGSNLLTKRIHIQNPTAKRKDIGQLKNYRLDFIGAGGKWCGASATVVPHPGETVWGAIWEIDMKNLSDLDDQEGVSANIYFPKTVDVELVSGETVQCRIYIKVMTPSKDAAHPANNPSLLYLSTIIHGAVECNLPEHYIEKLKTISHNEYFDEKVAEELNISKDCFCIN